MKHDSKTPYVNFFSILLLSEDLWSTIAERTHVFAYLFLRTNNCCYSKICYFGTELAISFMEKYIPELNVSVDYSKIMEMLNSLGDSKEDFFDIPFCEYSGEVG
jgi:hypothetical protein